MSYSGIDFWARLDMTHRILFISKFPPMQGGVASRTYWLAEGLARYGHSVHVITHAPDAAPQYSCLPDTAAELSSVNIAVHTESEATPWHIPDAPERTLTMLNLGMRVVDTESIDVIDTGYLVPYGVVGHLLKQSRGIPHVVRHGGSDIVKFLDKDLLAAPLADTLRSADAVVTDSLHSGRLSRFRQDAIVLPAYVPPDAFKPPTERGDRPIRVAYIGKVNYHREYKGLDRIASIMLSLSADTERIFMAQGAGLDRFQATLGHEAASSIKWRPFIHPSRMPGLLASIDALFVFESSLPHPDYSNLVAEALCSGVGIVTDRADLADTYADAVVPAEGQILAVLEKDSPAASARRITSWLQECRRSPAFQPTRRASFAEYICANEAVYDAVAAIHC